MLANGSDGRPLLMINIRCDYLIETLPTIVYAKETGGEQLDDDNEDHALDAMFYTLQTANKVRGKLFGKSELVKKAKSSFMAGQGVTFDDLNIGIADAIKSSGKKGRDWRTM